LFFLSEGKNYRTFSYWFSLYRYADRDALYPSPMSPVCGILVYELIWVVEGIWTLSAFLFSCASVFGFLLV